MNTNLIFENSNIKKMFFKIAIPGAIGMLASAIYQFIDGILVNIFLGAQAFSALNLAFPFVIMIYAISDLIGVGSSVIIAIKLGQNKVIEAKGIFTSALLIIFIANIILSLLTFFMASNLLKLMGATGILLELASTYLKVYAITLPLAGYIFALDNYLRIKGLVKTSLLINIIMSLFIISLESLLLGVFKLPVWASALATALGFVIFALISFMPFLFNRDGLSFGKPIFKITIILQIFRNGLPAFLSNVATRITAIILNYLLLVKGGEDAISSYGVLMYIDGFIQPLMYGMCDSLQPCIGYNYGQGKQARVKKITKMCFVANLVLCLLSFIFIISMPKTLANLFVSNGSINLKNMAKTATIIFAFTYLTKWFAHSTQSFFQAIEKPVVAIIISLGLSFIFPLICIPCFYSLGLNGYWLNMPMASLLTSIVSMFLLVTYLKKQKA